MRTFSLLIICSSFILAGCSQLPQPRVLGNNRTGAAIVTTPSTSGVTTISTGGQAACTEPRPNASLDTSAIANAELSAKQVEALVKGQGGRAAKIGESNEFERVEFLAHGFFGICQLLASNKIDNDQAAAMTKQLITSAAKLSSTEQINDQ